MKVYEIQVLRYRFKKDLGFCNNYLFFVHRKFLNITVLWHIYDDVKTITIPQQLFRRSIWYLVFLISGKERYQIADKQAIILYFILQTNTSTKISHNCKFISSWNNSSETHHVDIYSLTLAWRKFATYPPSAVSKNILHVQPNLSDSSTSHLDQKPGFYLTYLLIVSLS